jgi:hypothetical protein
MTVYLVVSLPKTAYIHCIHTVYARLWPTLFMNKCMVISLLYFPYIYHLYYIWISNAYAPQSSHLQPCQAASAVI